MPNKIITTDYFRHNLKDVVNEILETDQPVILKYGNVGEILLSSNKSNKTTKKKLLVKKLKAKVKSGKLKKTKYTNNTDLYQDFYKNNS